MIDETLHVVTELAKSYLKLGWSEVNYQVRATDWVDMHISVKTALEHPFQISIDLRIEDSVITVYYLSSLTLRFKGLKEVYPDLSSFTILSPAQAYILLIKSQ